jgi:hypothetical protein
MVASLVIGKCDVSMPYFIQNRAELTFLEAWKGS